MTAAWTIHSRRNQVPRAHSTSLSSLPDLSESYQMEDRSRCSSVSGLLYSNCRQPTSPSSLAWTSGLSNYHARSNTSVSFLGRRITREYRSTFILSDNQTVGVTRRETFQPEEAQVAVQVNLCLQSPPEDSGSDGSGATRVRAQSEPPCRLRIRESIDDDRWARIMLTTDEPQNSELLRRFGKGYSGCRDVGRNARKQLPCQITEDYRLQRDLTLPESDPSAAGPTHLGSNLHAQQRFPEETFKLSQQSATSYGISSVRPSEFSSEGSLTLSQSAVGETRLDVDGTYRQSGAYISRFPASIGNCSSVETFLQAANAPVTGDFIEPTLSSHGKPSVVNTTGSKNAPVATSSTASMRRHWTPTEEQQHEEEEEDFSTVRRRPHAVQSGEEMKPPAIVLMTDRPLTPAGLEIVGSSSSVEEPSTERVEKETCPKTARPHPTGLPGSQSQYKDKYTPEVQDSSSSVLDFSLSPLPATDRSESIIRCSRPSSAAVAAVSPNDDTVASVSSVPVDQQPVERSLDLRLARRKSLESGQDLTRSTLAKIYRRGPKCHSERPGPRSEPIGHARSRYDSDSSTEAPTITTPKIRQPSVTQAKDAHEIPNSSLNSSGLPTLVTSVSEEKPIPDTMGHIPPEDAQSPHLLVCSINSPDNRNRSTPDNADASTESGFIDAGAILSEPTTCSFTKIPKVVEGFENPNEKQSPGDAVILQDVRPKPRTSRQRRQNAEGIAPTDGSPTAVQPESASDRNRQVTLFGPRGKRSRESEDPHQEGVGESDERQWPSGGTTPLESRKLLADTNSFTSPFTQTLTNNWNDLRSGVIEQDQEKPKHRQRGLKLSELMLSGASFSPYSINKHAELHTSPRVNSMVGKFIGKENNFSDLPGPHEVADSSLSSGSEHKSQIQGFSVEHPIIRNYSGEPQAPKDAMGDASDRNSKLFSNVPLGGGDNAAREQDSNASSSVQSSLPHLSGESAAEVFGPPDMLPLFVVPEETGQHSGNAKRKPIVGNSEWSLEDIESLSEITSELDAQTSSVIHMLPKEGSQNETPHKAAGPQSVGSLLPPKSHRSVEEDGDGKAAMGSTDRPDSSEGRSILTKTPHVRDSPTKDSVQKNKRKPVVSPTHQEVSASINDTSVSSFRGPFDPRANDLDFEENAGFADHELKRRRKGQRQDEEARLPRGSTPLTDHSDLGSHRHRKPRKYPGSEQAPLTSAASSKHSSQDGDHVDRAYTQKDLEDYPDDVSVTSEEDEGVTDLDNEEDLRPPALRRDIEAEIISLPDEYSRPGIRPRLRPLRHPLYANLSEQQRTDDRVQKPRKRDIYTEPKPLRTRDQNVPESRLGVVSEKDLPDKLVVLTRRRTMSGITGRMPQAPSTSTTSLWFGDHPVPTKTQIDAADNAPVRLSNIQLQAQAELARRRTRSSHRGHSLDRVTASRILAGGGGIGTTSALGPSTSTLYGVRGKRMKGGAPLVERAISRRLSKRDGYETLSVVSIPHLPREKSPGTGADAATATRMKKRNDVRDGV
uniref:Uncharacterized protein n=1 Tax=Schistocephalus solidus TaxID=70667 RepID=A0A0V0J2W8_SCHSO